MVSPALLEEIAEVLERPKFRDHVTGGETADFVSLLRREALLVDDPPLEPGLTSDPGDDYLVGLARAASADVLVSGDPHLTRLREPRPPVMTPRAFSDGMQPR